MISKELLGYFAYSLNAIFTAENGKISYMNPAAKKLFPGVRVGDSAEVLGAETALHDRPGVFTAMIFDVPCNVTSTVISDTSVFTVYPIDDEVHHTNTELMDSVCRSMTESLSVIKMSGELMQSYIDASQSEKAAKYAAAVNHSLYKLMRMTANLSKIYGFEKGKRSEKTFDIAQLCSELTSTVAELVGDKGLDISFVGVAKGMSFYGDSKEIERLLLNLLSNSIKYSSYGSKIAVSISTNGKRVTISVSDSGCGISPEVMSGVFGRYNEKKDTTDGKAGAGMGLWIVKSIAEEHGGNVMLSSREDLGTVVTVSLPVKDSGKTELHTPAHEFETGNMKTVLTELSDVLGYEKYMSKYLD